jgi:hypothetical protein
MRLEKKEVKEMTVIKVNTKGNTYSGIKQEIQAQPVHEVTTKYFTPTMKPRKRRVSTRALGTNPRAKGTNPRANRDTV